MTDLRWAARYSFCDVLWRGRARWILDPQLEAVLHDPRSAAAVDAPWRKLLDDLLPVEPGVPVWMVLSDGTNLPRLAEERPGVRFVAGANGREVLSGVKWEVALVTLMERAGALGASETQALLPLVARGLVRGATAVLATDGAADFEEFAEMAAAQARGSAAGDPRLFGVLEPAMMGFVELAADDDAGSRADHGGAVDTDGASSEADGEPDKRVSENVEGYAAREDDDADGEDDPADREAADAEDADAEDADHDREDADSEPLAFDNTLTEGPVFRGYLAVVGSVPFSAEGLTLVELPTPEPGPERGLLQQLHEARHQAERLGAERQSLIEQVDALESERVGLQEAASGLRDQLAVALGPAGAGERLDEVLAREQSLRWRVASLERELAELRARPVSELEAENAALRARMGGISAPSVAPDLPVASGESQGTSPDSPSQVDRRVTSPNSQGPRRTAKLRATIRRLAPADSGFARRQVLGAVEQLARRCAHGTLTPEALGRELQALRRRLRG